MTQIKLCAIVLAAGSGTRMGAGTPKQYRDLDGMMVLRRTLQALLSLDISFEKIVVVIDPAHSALFETARHGFDQNRIVAVEGGPTRQSSVFCGLKALEDLNPDRVILHDAARPFAAPVLFQRILKTLQTQQAAICGVKVHDTLKRCTNGVILETMSREGLYQAQTPQGFNYIHLLAAHEKAVAEKRNEFTDDAALMEWQGHDVTMVEGDMDNFKITTETDFVRAADKISARVSKTAFGYDVHAFCDGDHVTLGGVKIPHDKCVKAHSDGDVVLHALTDALFGLTGTGDIGTHFPPSDAQWKNAASEQFVAKAMAELKNADIRLIHCDISVLCEAPKLMPYRDGMLENLARLTGLEPRNIGLKATTSEGLGFVGRGEGLAAYVIVTGLVHV